MNLFRSAATVSSFTLLSRVTDSLRDLLIARLFGASAETDAFAVAFRLPNLLRRIFAEGAFSQAFVPILAECPRAQGADANPQSSGRTSPRRSFWSLAGRHDRRRDRCAGPGVADRHGLRRRPGGVRTGDAHDALDVSVHPVHVAGRAAAGVLNTFTELRGAGVHAGAAELSRSSRCALFLAPRLRAADHGARLCGAARRRAATRPCNCRRSRVSACDPASGGRAPGARRRLSAPGAQARWGRRCSRSRSRRSA